MPYLLGLLLALASIALLAWPVLKRRSQADYAPSSSPFDSLSEAQRQRQQVYDEIKTLTLDHDLGHVPSQEYSDRLGAYRLRAASLLRQQERLSQDLSRLTNEIEDEVLALRLSWGTALSVAVCGECGGERDAEALLCPRCESPGAEQSDPAEEEAPWAEQ